MKPSAADKEAQKQAVLFEEKVKNGEITIDGGMKFAEYAERWIESSDIRPTTQAAVKYNLLHINQAIGHIPLDKLRPEHLQQFYKNLRESGVKSNDRCVTFPGLRKAMEDAGITQKGLAKLAGVNVKIVRSAFHGGRVFLRSAELVIKALADMGIKTNGLFVYEKGEGFAPSTILTYHNLIRTILNSAKKSRIIPNNPTEFMNTPKADTPEARYMDEVQAREYLAALLNEPDIRIRTALITLLFTGMRRGELCGLEWRDIDWLDGKISIRRASYYVPGNGKYESLPKTKGSVRAIKVEPFLLDVLMMYRDWQNSEAAKLGDTWHNEKDRLFTAQNGEPLNPVNIND